MFGDRPIPVTPSSARFSAIRAGSELGSDVGLVDSTNAGRSMGRGDTGEFARLIARAGLSVVDASIEIVATAEAVARESDCRSATSFCVSALVAPALTARCREVAVV